ncbi:hypothetical protein EDD85DRAFT_817735 [Armillaria nabsnona]|nr:hypothetical protein EDD85DRAFT_817735 [Armillaria nabsnona]
MRLLKRWYGELLSMITTSFLRAGDVDVQNCQLYTVQWRIGHSMFSPREAPYERADSRPVYKTSSAVVPATEGLGRD